MGVYIRGMDMPKACVFCELYDGELYWCRGAKKEIPYSSADERADNCPLVPAPPHGRLIEKNAVFELIRSFPSVDRQLPVEFMKALYELPTIIEAEEGE